MSSKAALKAAKAALDAQNYSEAVTQARSVLEADPDNYFGNVFLGRALEKQGNLDEAIEPYGAATRLKPQDELAWKGLCGIFQAQGSRKVDDHTNVSMALAQIYADLNDRDQCHSVINKLVDFARDNGTRAQYRHALECTLPASPIYEFLEGRLPSPSFTFIRIAEILEADERERINKEIGERRMRLGAKLTQVTAEVRREVFSNSQLEALYQDIINWSSDDEVRRSYEEKLLQRGYDHLCVLSLGSKADKLATVQKLASDMVIIKHPYKLAWHIDLEWKDAEEMGVFDKNVLLEYMDFFPKDGLSLALMSFMGITATQEDANSTEDSTKQKKREEITESERLLLLSDALENSKGSVLTHRLAAAYYLSIEEYESCVDVARAALPLLQVEARKSGLPLQDTLDAIRSSLGTSLVYFQSPKNHPEAMEIFEEILSRKPQDPSSLLGIGLIYEERMEFDKASESLHKAMLIDPSNQRIQVEAAWCTALNGDLAAGLESLQQLYEQLDLDVVGRDLKALTAYRIGQCMWQLNADKSSRKSRTGPYAFFLAAIKINPNLAAAYTSLGIYYVDYYKDRKRSRQCFQKAFELASTEVEAAKRLAHDFAKDGDWEIVEAIAERVIDAGVVRPPPGSKRPGHSWPFSALGIVQMNRQDYSQSVTSFQTALRISPHDYNAWVGLGESYHSSGRYNAARRTLEHALGFEEGGDNNAGYDTWFAQYMLANVHRELGEFDMAITGYHKVLSSRPSEFGVSLALLQTLVERAYNCIETGFFGLAASSAEEAISFGNDSSATDIKRTFNFWKAIADACAVFTMLPAYADTVPLQTALALIKQLQNGESNEILLDIDGVEAKSLNTGIGMALLSSQISLLANKTAVQIASNDVHAHAIAWYNLGWAEFLCYKTSKVSVANTKQKVRFSKAAIRCFKRAIELEASNPEFWNALGVVTMQLNTRISQHSLIRSLNISERSARTWTNLGVLYLLQNDLDLAHEAFSRAQSTDPEYAHAWVGEGIIALLTGDQRECLIHFTHAMEITDSGSSAVKTRYVTSAFDALISNASMNDVFNELVLPVFGLQQLQSQVSSQVQFRHLLALMRERIGDYNAANDLLLKIVDQAEVKYEETESEAALTQYIKAKTDLARVQLALDQFEDAAQNAETVLDLSSEAEEGDMNAESRLKSRLSAQLTAGLARYRSGNLGKALEVFRTALDEHGEQPDVTCVIAQVLWAKGTDEDKETARDQLFDCAARNTGHAATVMLLGAISALDDDSATAEAVASDLQSLRTDDKLSFSVLAKVEALVNRLAMVRDPDDTKVAAASIVLSPEKSTGWAALGLSTSDPYVREMALSTAKRSAPPTGAIDPEGLAEAFASEDSVAGAQVAVMLCPWSLTSHKALALSCKV